MLKTIKGGTPPIIKTKYSSSADLFARETVSIKPSDTALIPLGVKIDFSQLTELIKSTSFLELKIRSSIAYVHKLIVPNGVGEIDIDYPDEIKLLVYNGNNHIVTVKEHSRIAQIKLMKHEMNSNLFSNFKSNTTRVGGFGSTDEGSKDVTNSK